MRAGAAAAFPCRDESAGLGHIDILEAIADMVKEDRRDMSALMLCVIRYLDDAGVADDHAAMCHDGILPR